MSQPLQPFTENRISVDPHIRDVTGKSDPWNFGQQVMALPGPGGPGGGVPESGSVGSPLGDISGAAGEVLEGTGKKGDFDLEDEAKKVVDSQTDESGYIKSDADPPTQTTFSQGGKMYHLRMTGPSSGGSTGRYGVATHIGDAGV